MFALRNGARRAVLCLFVAATSLMGGCASVYVDGTTKEVRAAQFKKPASPVPVQLLFDFQTKGVANAQATAFLRERVVDQVKASGLFSEVGSNAVPSGALLTITLNNVPLTDNAFSKGFVTGLTFGLAGSQVSDGYVCTANYRAAGDSAALTKQARHAIHTTLGAAATPGNATKMDSAKDAVYLMTQQIVSNVLNDLSQDANFK
ncbi:hypothetical protein J2X20_003383 [Pelomonas saccharophila]|uniref:Lipoprotein n=1 Tax=Roseateles saccharophilus TaxID=304 RepID=A0ABU1YR72_ROSSA|nr:hypothetical protein [Roseateles saccharophilus]MDR7270725.1 hypothetical protein [Roseateles saccharophilus]